MKHVYDGYNVCVLAYGGAGTGKTHTLHGSVSGGVDGGGKASNMPTRIPLLFF